MKSLGTGCKRQHRQSILSKIELRKHLSAGGPRADSEDELVAPSSGHASRLDDMGQRQKKSPCTFRIHSGKYGVRRPSAQMRSVDVMK
jgi:hypothetical protein